MDKRYFYAPHKAFLSLFLLSLPFRGELLIIFARILEKTSKTYTYSTKWTKEVLLRIY